MFIELAHDNHNNVQFVKFKVKFEAFALRNLYVKHVNS